MCHRQDLAPAHPVLLSISLVNSKVGSPGSHQSHTTRSTLVLLSCKNMSFQPPSQLDSIIFLRNNIQQGCQHVSPI